jgi:dephospho-CoA kinase
MRKLLKIGVTGGIGSGKSIVSKVFGLLGIPVYYSDVESKKLIHIPQVQEEIKQHFGAGLFTGGSLNTKALADIVFTDPARLELLNSILHPRVRTHFIDWVKQQESAYVVKEAAIMFESGAYRDLDHVIAVSAPEKLRIQRVMRRDNTDEAGVRIRMSRQMTEEERNSRADFIVINDDRHLLLPQVLDLHKRFIGEGS